jgi:hypothetical protein
MHKSSKKIKGPVTEDIPEALHEKPIEYLPENVASAILELPSDNPIEPLEPEEVGIQVYVYMPKHSKSARKLIAAQFKAGLTKEAGVILLPDGQLIKIGATVKTEMLPELKVMLRDGVFLAGKAPRRS